MTATPTPPTQRPISHELWLLLAITALGALLRFYRLATLPPGDGYDVAQYGVDAMHILAGARPIFFETNFGREALFSYLVSAVYLITGPGTLGIRIAAALVGTLTIPANYLVAREMVPNRQSVMRYLPLLVALLTAVSYWHLVWSRMGLRVILVPLFASLLFYFLWRGLRGLHWLNFAVAGLLLGVSIYTYQPARLLPVLVIVAFVLNALSRRSWTRHDSAALLLVSAIALLVYVPMGLFARDHPGALTVRIEQASLYDPAQSLGPQLTTIFTQSLDALAMYGIRGDMDPLVNIPGRPSLDPFLFAFLLVGIGVALWRFRRPTYLFLLAWLAVMTAPAMLADLAALSKRALGAQPAAMVLIALGLLVPLAWLRSESGRRPLALLYVFGIAAGLLFSTWQTARDYFVVWAADPDLPMHFQADFAAIGAGIGRLPVGDRAYLSPHPPDQPVIQLHSNLRPDVRGYNGRFCLIYPDPSGPTPAATWFIAAGLDDRSFDRLQQMYPDATTDDGPLRPNSDQPLYHTVSILPNAAPVTQPDQPTSYTWGDNIQLLGYTLSNITPAPGETVELDLYYRPLRAGLPDLTAFVHMLGDPSRSGDSLLWAQSDSTPCQGFAPTSQWQPGDILLDTITLTIPPDTLPGVYQLVTGFYTWPDLVRQPLRGTDTTAAGLQVIQVRPADN